MNPNHYEVLGVGASATGDEIKAAYHRQAAIHHPDKGGSKHKMAAVNAAYKTLRDPKRRKAYDQSLIAALMQRSAQQDPAAQQEPSPADPAHRAASLGFDAGRRIGTELLDSRAARTVKRAAAILDVEDVPGALGKAGAEAAARLVQFVKKKAKAADESS